MLATKLCDIAAKPPRSMHAGSKAASTALALLLASAFAASPVAGESDCSKTDNWLLPAGQVLTVEEDYKVSAKCDIEILGAIVGATGSGASIHLRAGRSITILGVIAAGDGDAGQSTEGTDGIVTASDGEDGGSIFLWGGRHPCASGCEATVLIGPNAAIRAGNGGDGGDASLQAHNSSADCNCAVAGNGGDAGSVYIRGPMDSILAFGRLVPGTAGEGGTAEASGRGVIALGGGGGGATIILVQHEALGQVLDRNIDGLAGNGGQATALVDCTPVNLEGCPGEDDAQPCEPTTLLFDLLGDSGSDFDRTAAGGPGGDGTLYGGKGGDAIAAGCNRGGQGNSGTPGNDEGEPYAYSNPTDGERGHQGPTGGGGTATGGKGGVGILRGGDGGPAEGNGGVGGRGGTGGEGGSANAFGCAQPGDGGPGGKGGTGGISSARGGDGGDALFVLGSGGLSPRGTGTPGGGGPPGRGAQPGGLGGGCSNTGFPGAPGDPGDVGGIVHETGDNGSAGDMSISQVASYLEGKIQEIICGGPCIE